MGDDREALLPLAKPRSKHGFVLTEQDCRWFEKQLCAYI